MNKNKLISVRISQDLFEQLNQKIAELNKKTDLLREIKLSDFIRYCLKEQVKTVRLILVNNKKENIETIPLTDNSCKENLDKINF